MHKFLRYIVVAFGSAIIDWLIFSISIFFSLGSPLFCLMLSRISGGIFSFISNKYWSFSSFDQRQLGSESRRFIILYGFSYLLSIIIFFMLTKLSFMSIYLSKLMTDSIVFLVNYAVMNRYVFKNSFGFKNKKK